MLAEPAVPSMVSHCLWLLYLPWTQSLLSVLAASHGQTAQPHFGTSQESSLYCWVTLTYYHLQVKTANQDSWEQGAVPEPR